MMTDQAASQDREFIRLTLGRLGWAIEHREKGLGGQ
jgi:hypothetical protein